MASQSMPMLSTERLREVLALIKGADTVELKVSVQESERYTAISALGLDPLDAQIRQVAFFDTPDLRLNECGVVVRARRIQGKPADSVVKLRPVVPEQLPASLRSNPGFGVEVDALPGSFICSGRLRAYCDDATVKNVFATGTGVRALFNKQQRALFAAHAPQDVSLDDLVVLGPINILKLKYVPPGFGRRLVAELWFYPDDSRILELSTKCLPSEAFQVLAELKALLNDYGIDMLGEQRTKTKTALRYFSGKMAGLDVATPNV